MSANKSEEHPVQLVNLSQENPTEQEQPMQLVNFSRENPNELKKPDGSSSLVTEGSELPRVDPRYQKHCVTATIIGPDNSKRDVSILRDTGALQSRS